MIGVSCGALITIQFAHKTYILNVSSVYFILFLSFLISLMIFLNPIYTPFGLFGAGFCIGGIAIGLIGDMSFVPERGDPKFGGRFLSRELMYSSIFVIIYALINLTPNFFLTIIFFLIISIIASVFSLAGQKNVQIITQEHLNIIKHLKNKKNLPKLAIGFFHGFFIINSYYALIFRSLGLEQYLNIFVLILFITISIILIPAGTIALAFLILSFLIQINFVLIIVFVCTECGVLYCLKCAKALSILKNQCWACNTPIDQSKPIKPLIEEQDESKEEVK